MRRSVVTGWTGSRPSRGRTTPEAGTEGTPAATGEAPSAGGLSVVAKDIKFDPATLKAAAGAVSITFKNEDSTIHNLHVFKGSDAKGESVGSTKPEAGPKTETLNLDLQPGQYFYQCDVHPDQMKGKLTVS